MGRARSGQGEMDAVQGQEPPQDRESAREAEGRRGPRGKGSPQAGLGVGLEQAERTVCVKR